MNVGSARESFAPIGSNLPGFDNYFCRDCRHILHVRKGSPGFRACPTPRCTRPTAFGVFATMLRPCLGRATISGNRKASTRGTFDRKLLPVATASDV